jgi:hypothetical protein
MNKQLLAATFAALLSSAGTAATLPSRDGVPSLDHVFLIVLENHAYGDIIGNTHAPFLNRLAATENLATRYSGVRHPSLPNYLCMIAGDYFDVEDDDAPTTAVDAPAAKSTRHHWSIKAPSIAGQLVAAGRDWRSYQQSLPAIGSLLAAWPGDSNTGALYAVKHNPFAYFTEVQTRPAEQARMRPLEALYADLGSGRLPALSFIVPDQCRDMHGIGNPLAPCAGMDFNGGLVARGDQQLQWIVEAIVGSASWQRGRNALFVVFDEGNGPAGQDPVVAITVTNYGVRATRDDSPYNHYSLLKTMEAAFGLPYLGHAADPGVRTMAPMLAPVAGKNELR